MTALLTIHRRAALGKGLTCHLPCNSHLNKGCPGYQKSEKHLSRPFFYGAQPTRALLLGNASGTMPVQINPPFCMSSSWCCLHRCQELLRACRCGKSGPEAQKPNVKNVPTCTNTPIPDSAVNSDHSLQQGMQPEIPC